MLQHKSDQLWIQIDTKMIQYIKKIKEPEIEQHNQLTKQNNEKYQS